VQRRQEVGNMQVAIVTGASKGLGRALSAGLVADGWSLVIGARGADQLTGTADWLSGHTLPGQTVTAVPGDITHVGHRVALVDAAATLGGLDMVVNNASTLGESPLPHLVGYPLESLRDVLETDVVAPIALVQRSIELLMRSPNPRILNITSDASVEHYEGWGGYGLAKAALDHFAATLGVEVPRLRSWALDPGDLRTDMHQAAFPGEDISDRPLPETVVPRVLALVASSLPSGRYRAADIPASSETKPNSRSRAEHGSHPEAGLPEAGSPAVELEVRR
jgi:NAD(P)-dependent dehydrogenase (short-subunit alcohol dehydrogenase family)